MQKASSCESGRDRSCGCQQCGHDQGRQILDTYKPYPNMLQITHYTLVIQYPGESYTVKCRPETEDGRP
jgi:hypothetical protein